MVLSAPGTVVVVEHIAPLVPVKINHGNIMIKKTLLNPDIPIYKSPLAAPRY